MEKSVITDKKQLDKTFIRNEGKLAEKWLGVLGETYSSHDRAFYLVYEKGCVSFMEENTMQGGCGGEWLLNNGYREITLNDFQEEVEEEVKTDNNKIIQRYVREDFKTRGEALNYFDTEGNTLYVPNITGYTVANEMDILDSFGQLFTLEEREETWQDAAQEFIKDNPILSKDKFVEDMFGDEFLEYHEPMKQLAKIIVEYNKEG